MNINLLTEMLAFNQLAEMRLVIEMSFRLAKYHLEAAITAQGSSPELDDLMHDCSVLLESLHQIDESVAEYFACDGSIN